MTSLCARTNQKLNSMSAQSNLKAQFMEVEWCIKVKSRSTIGTHKYQSVDVGIITLSQHSHGITTPSMPSPCTSTNQEYWPRFYLKSNMKAPFIQVEWCIDMESRPTIGTHICVMIDEGIITVSFHSHGITAPSMPPPCT